MYYLGTASSDDQKPKYFTLGTSDLV
jgi:hypothetical protein